MRSLIAILLSICSVSPLTGQDILHVGDPVPDIPLGKIIHYNGPEKKIADFKGRLLILDFWATWCAPCVKSLPRMDSLQKKYKNFIFILPVNELSSENESKVLGFLNRNQIHIPTVVKDTVLGKLFPHHIIPHEVWIDSKGTLIDITSSDQVNEYNIERVLHGFNIKLKQKKDITTNMFIPLFLHGNGGNAENPLYRCILTDSVEGLPGYVSPFRDESGKMVGFSAHVPDLSLFYTTLTFNNGFPNGKRVFFQSGNDFTRAPDSILLFPLWTPWPGISIMKDYAYSMFLPRTSGVTDSMFFRKYMLDDLNRCFPYTGKIEKKMMPCLVIITLDNKAKDLLKSRHTESRVFYSEGPNIGGTRGGHDIIDRLQNIPFNYFLNVIASFPYTDPIINESGIDSESVDMDLHLKNELDDAWNKSLDIISVKKALNKYGLDIVSENREAEVLVFYKKD